MFNITYIISAMTGLIGVATSAVIPSITNLWCTSLIVALFIIGVVVAFIFSLAGSRSKRRRK